MGTEITQGKDSDDSLASRHFEERASRLAQSAANEPPPDISGESAAVIYKVVAVDFGSESAESNFGF